MNCNVGVSLSATPDGRRDRGSGVESTRKQRARIEPLKDVADTGMRGRTAPVQLESRVQDSPMGSDEGAHAPIRVGTGDDREQQNIRKLVEPALCPERIGNVFRQIR